MEEGVTGRNRSKEIIEVAYRLFADKGYNNTSIRDICKTMNISKSGIYHYIKSKEDLFNQVEKYVYDDFEGLFKDEEYNSLTDLKKRIQRFIHEFVRLVLANKNVVFILIERSIVQGEGEFAGECKERRDNFLNNLRRLLREAENAGMSYGDIDITVAAFILLSMITWLSMWFDPKGKINVDELSKSVSNFFVRGFLK